MTTPDRAYSRYQLSKSIRRRIQEKEVMHNRTCRALWTFTNPKGEQYLYGRFVKDRTDKLIVTVAYCHPNGFMIEV